MTPEPEKKPKPIILPLFRKDLVVYPGPSDPDGTPTYSLQDPVRGQFFKVTWAHALIIRVHKPGMSIEELAEAVNTRSPLRVTVDEIKDIFAEAAHLNLLTIPKRSEDVQEMLEKSKMSWVWWAVMNYLYIRYPLLNPDKFLTDTLKYVTPLISKPALIFYAILTFTGLFILFFNFERYIHTFTYFFNLEGVVAYSLAISLVHLLHEFGHAYTAKYFKVHVPTMGVGLMVLVPFLFTNVTDAWKLKDRRKRFAITIAGVAVEIVLAGLATLGWALTDPGLLHSIFFIVSSTSWVTSLLMNLNPAMRFDGYYLFSDLIGVDNLQQRAFAMTRWKLREWFLKLNIPPPEEDLPYHTVKLMMIYSVYTWFYRITLYTGIALFVYYEFTKLLGIILFIIEVVVFIAAPFASEIKQLYLRRSFFNWNLRSFITAILTTILIVWFVVPWPHTLYLPAVTVPEEEQIVYAPEHSAIKKIYVHRGESVKKGDKLIELDSDIVKQSIEKAKIEVDLLKKTLEILALSDTDRTYLTPKVQELEHKEAELNALEKKLERMIVIAEIDGEVHDWDNDLYEGMNLTEGTVIGKVDQVGHLKVMAYVTEFEVDGLKVGEKGDFKLLDPVIRFPVELKQIFKTPATVLKYPALASTYKGSLPVIPKKEGKPGDNTPRLLLTDRYYEVEFSLDPTEYPLKIGQTGVVEIKGQYESLLWSLIKRVERVIWRESGF